MMFMRKTLLFRAWYYFRAGWSTYFAFIMGAINTATVTYYLAIEKAPILKEMFPSFLSYILIASALGIPILVAIGYIHFKKSLAFRAEADISIEANPHFRRMLLNTEVIFPLHLKMSEMILKLSKSEKITEEDRMEISDLQKQIIEHMKKRTIE